MIFSPYLVYSLSKANNFLSYNKCMQRMKCPVTRKEECSEECHAGNTEEEIEEHKEIIIGEHRNSFRKKPKPKFDDEELKNLTIKNDF
ncbi:unnamed protein product [Adineta steineri]|uniref:Uncharacterized protein n=1 Tax=Adineta steineri TaxID=433720 RepID=A0A816DPW9_9BILA|nr:unnamed protein product [Adineta steineri]CAF1635753.1 unnamed protein product [Adineta steineri]